MKSLLTQIEISFWNVAIRLMTHSESVRLIAGKSMQILQNRQTLLYSAIVVFWGFIGLVTGFMLGRFGYVLR